jgi:hypothetical protein
MGMKSENHRGWTLRLIQAVAILAGLWGGWVAAGMLNNHRDDVPRPIPPAAAPAATAAVH